MNQLITLIIEGYFMQFLGSVIYITSSFYGFVFRKDSLVHWTHSFLYFHDTSGFRTFQDGIFSKNPCRKLEKLCMDNPVPGVLY